MVQTNIPSDLVQQIRDMKREISELRKRTGLGQGRALDTPYIPYGPLGRDDPMANWPGNTGSSFARVYFTHIPVTHPRFLVEWSINEANGTGQAEGRLTWNGTQVGPTLATPGTLTMQGIFDIPGFTESSYLGTWASVQFETRVSSGTGKAVANVYSFYGVGYRATY